MVRIPLVFVRQKNQQLVSVVAPQGNPWKAVKYKTVPMRMRTSTDETTLGIYAWRVIPGIVTVSGW